MLDKKLILFIILLLGLLLCSLLGGTRCMKEGFKDDSSSKDSKSKDSSSTDTVNGTGSDGSTHVGPNGHTFSTSTDNLNSNSSSNGSINGTATGKYSDGSTHVGPNGNTFSTSTNNLNSNSNNIPPPNNQTLDTITQTNFYGPHGGDAKVVNMNGTYYIRVTDPNGTSTDYTINSNNNNNNGNNNNSSQDSNSIYGVTFTGQSGGQAKVINSNGNHIIEVVYPNGEKMVFTQNSSGTNNNNNNMFSVDSTLNNGSQYPSKSTSAYYYPSSSSSSSMNSNGQYDSTMPRGVPKSNIPEGDEDLYILKSQVIAPVCPACPVSSACPKKDAKAPPCPACARCPESNFECKKVPNYNAVSDQFLPMPVLNSFSTFGM